eukprot:15342110-Ditylum_brightwellii.AAC.1
MPQLLVNIGFSNKLIAYETGTGTDMLTFYYTTTDVDSTDRLDWVFLPDSDSALFCDKTIDPPCDIKNSNGDDVNLAFVDPSSGIDIPQLNALISIDTSAPKIIGVYMNKTRPSYCASLSYCSYTVGEIIPIFVDFDAPVVITGPSPRLLLDLGETEDTVLEGSYALYEADLSTETRLCFIYAVGEGHSSSGKNLAYMCAPNRCALDIGDLRLTSIRRKSSSPSTEANLTLPVSLSSGISVDPQNPVIIDTSKKPNVTEVVSLTENGIYAPGDTIQICVKFSEVVIVSGVPFLSLDVGQGEIGIAEFVSGSGTRDLIFNYIIEEKHISLDLDYVDIHSLQVGKDGVFEGSIKHASTVPIVDANIQLVNPGKPGSLAASSDIMVDSRE